MKYYHLHAMIALAAQFVFAGLLLTLGAPVIAAFYGGGAVGATIYISREIRDKEKLGYWDHKGWVWPLISVILMWGIVVMSIFFKNVYMK